jgi:hypothetical protein
MAKSQDSLREISKAGTKHRANRMDSAKPTDKQQVIVESTTPQREGGRKGMSKNAAAFVRSMNNNPHVRRVMRDLASK